MLTERNGIPAGLKMPAGRVWLSLVLWVAISILAAAVPPGGAREGAAAADLTLEEARSLALAGNFDLKIARLSLERGELALSELAARKADLERGRQDLAGYRSDLEAEEQELRDEIAMLEDLEERTSEEDERLERARMELSRVQAALRGVETALESLDRLIEQAEEQEKASRERLADGREAIKLQEALVLFAVDSLYTSILILEEQSSLQHEAAGQLEMLLANDREKEKAGYSSPLQVEEAASKVRQARAAIDTLAAQRAAAAGELLLACGLTPGSRLTVRSFSPPGPQSASLELSLEQALSSGWLVQSRRQELARREADLQRARDLAGEDSIAYRLALLDCREAELKVRQAEEQTRAAVYRTFSALGEKERQVNRAIAGLELGLRLKQAIQAQLDAGYITAAEAAAGPLALRQKEAELRVARYQLYLAGRELDLARQGYIVPGR